MDEKMNLTIVYIDDDAKMKEDAFLDDIRDDVDDIQYFEKPSDGLSYIKDHIDQNIVVILDWKFNSNLGDIFGLLFAYYAYKLTGKWDDSKKKEGYQQGMHKAAIANAVILLVTVGAVVVEAIHRYQYPSSMSGKVILITALIGVLVNGLTAFLLVRYKKKDQHVKGAYWYMVADTLISALVAVIGLVIIIKPTLTFIDPVLGIILAIFILVATIRLLHNNLKLVHDGYPSGVTKDDVELVIGNHKNVASVHRVHVWALNAHEYSMTAHFSLHDISKLEETKKEVKDSLKNRLAIDHVTLELDASEDWKKEDSNDKQ